MTIMGGNPYSGMSSGSPPNSLPLSVNSSPFNYQNGETNYSPPTGASPKESPTSTPINGYSQVRHRVSYRVSRHFVNFHFIVDIKKTCKIRFSFIGA